MKMIIIINNLFLVGITYIIDRGDSLNSFWFETLSCFSLFHFCFFAMQKSWGACPRPPPLLVLESFAIFLSKSHFNIKQSQVEQS